MDYLILISSIVLGAGTVFWLRLGEPAHLKLLNAFTGAYLLSLTLLHLLPEVYHVHGGGADHGLDHGHGTLLIGSLMLAGFFVQVGLDFFSKGVEHGHADHVERRFPFGIVAGLCLHALVEATALGDPHQHFDVESRRLLLWSIVIHNYPVSIALLGILLESGLERRVALGWLGFFACMAPIGMFVGSHTPLAHYSRELMAFVIGIFMHIATTILFESSDAHRINLGKLLAIFVGTLLGVASIVLH